MVNASVYSSGLRWFYALLPTPKVFAATALLQLSCPLPSIDAYGNRAGKGCAMINVPDVIEPVQVSAYVSGRLENDAGSWAHQIGYLVLICTVIRIVTIVAMYRVSHLKR
jgi:hypothetical protein